MQHTHAFITTLLLAAQALLQAADGPQPQAKPNVIFIMADDK
jgi:hypothetical protein